MRITHTCTRRAAALAAGLILATAAGAAAAATADSPKNWHWVASWGAAQMAPEPQN